MAVQGRILLRVNRQQEAETILWTSLSIDRYNQNVYDDLVSIYVAKHDKKHLYDILTRYYDILPPGSPKTAVIANTIRQLGSLPL